MSRRWVHLRAVPGRADAVRPAGNCHVLQGTDGLFFGVDHLQVVNAVLAADLSHDPGQGAHTGLVDIRNLKGRGLHLIARAHGADHRNARRPGPKDDLLLAGNGVDGIHHIVILGKSNWSAVSGMKKVW